MKRTNFYIDDERIAALKHVARTEHVSLSDLIREGIDRVIRERLSQPTDRAHLQADLASFIESFAGRESGESDEQIDELVTRVNGRGTQIHV